MEWLDTQAMLWFAGRWSWFPCAQIGTESVFECRDNRAEHLSPHFSQRFT
jgi:hypothetical protein